MMMMTMKARRPFLSRDNKMNESDTETRKGQFENKIYTDRRRIQRCSPFDK